MLTYEDAKRLFESVTLNQRSRSRWQDSADDNFAATYRFIEGVWNSYPKMIPNEQTVMNLISKEFSSDPRCKYMKPLGEFKELDITMSHKDIYESWVRKLTIKRKDGLRPEISMIRIFLDQACDLQETMLDIPLTKRTIINAFSAMMFNLSKGAYQEVKITRYLIAKYKNHATIGYKAAPCNFESSDIDGIFFCKATREVVDYVSIKTGGALTNSSIQRYRGILDEKNEKYFKATGRRKPVPTLWLGTLDENDKGLTSFRVKDLY